MKITIKELVLGNENSCLSCLTKLTKTKIASSMTYKLCMLINELKPHIAAYEEAKNKLISTYIGEVEDIKDLDNHKEFTKELNDLVDTEVELKTEIPTLKVWVISDKGEASAPLPTTYENGILKFKIGPQPWYNPSTIYYLIRL